MTYRVSKIDGLWRITRITPEGVTKIDAYPQRNRALTVARLLAGRTGRVILMQ